MLYDNDGNVIERTVGTTVKVQDGYTYWGDGEGTYWTKAIIFENGEFVPVAGESAWSGYAYLKHKDKNTVDAPQETQDAYVAHLAKIKSDAERERFNRDAYLLRVGNYAIIEAGPTKRKRKNQGRCGVILKLGQGAYGPWVLLKDDEGETFISNAGYVAVIPDWEEAWPEREEVA